VLEAGDVVVEILEQAEAWPADLVVMGTRGRRTSNGWAMGSVTERVLRRASCSVLTVPRPQPEDGCQRGSFRRILCPLDFSEPSRWALDYAVSLASAYGADLTLLHVLEWFPEEHGEPSRFCIPEYHLDLSQDATDRMRRVVAEQGGASCAHEELVASGRPHHEILRVAQTRSVDLIALGVHGRRAIDQVLSGSTLCHVAREAPCPVLAVRSH
jgi:nucleotide-binding universal stress UspA family protein